MGGVLVSGICGLDGWDCLLRLERYLRDYIHRYLRIIYIGLDEDWIVGS